MNRRISWFCSRNSDQSVSADYSRNNAPLPLVSHSQLPPSVSISTAIVKFSHRIGYSRLANSHYRPANRLVYPFPASNEPNLPNRGVCQRQEGQVSNFQRVPRPRIDPSVRPAIFLTVSCPAWLSLTSSHVQRRATRLLLLGYLSVRAIFLITANELRPLVPSPSNLLRFPRDLIARKGSRNSYQPLEPWINRWKTRRRVTATGWKIYIFILLFQLYSSARHDNVFAY